MACGATFMAVEPTVTSEGDTLTPVAEASIAPRLVLNRQGLLENSCIPAWTCTEQAPHSESTGCP